MPPLLHLQGSPILAVPLASAMTHSTHFKSCIPGHSCARSNKSILCQTWSPFLKGQRQARESHACIRGASMYRFGACRPHEQSRHQVLRPAPQGPGQSPSSVPGPQRPQSCAGMQAEAAPGPNHMPVAPAQNKSCNPLCCWAFAKHTAPMRGCQMHRLDIAPGNSLLASYQRVRLPHLRFMLASSGGAKISERMLNPWQPQWPSLPPFPQPRGTMPFPAQAAPAAWKCQSCRRLWPCVRLRCFRRPEAPQGRAVTPRPSAGPSRKQVQSQWHHIAYAFDTCSVSCQRLVLRQCNAAGSRYQATAGRQPGLWQAAFDF